ncbi:MAG: alcohol dehydrogenase catalytic domain-containing protein [Geminicoccaceae bacterium]|nr:alcohol dehydrogenase catalytic domain-containing protein [Geminicoccaceae bacterium]
MKSLQIVEWGKPLEARDYPTPEPKGTEVLLEVTACGVCHSDLHIWQGYFDLGDGERLRIADRGMQLPFTLGHETAGRVIAKGPDARGVEIGESRVVYPWIGCGVCADCKRGEELLCVKPRVIGTWVNGGYATHVIVPHARYLVDHGDVPVEVACTYACSGITAYSALNRTRITRHEQTLLLIGAGGVGMNGILMAREVLGCKVIVADVDPAKRKAAMDTGACDAVFDNGEEGAAEAIRDWSQGGVDAAIDFVGRPVTTRFGMACARIKSTRIVVVGLYGDSMKLSVAALPLRLMTLEGSYVGTLADLHAVMRLAKAGKLPPIAVTGCPLHDANAAMERLTDGKVTGRIVLKPGLEPARPDTRHEEAREDHR